MCQSDLDCDDALECTDTICLPGDPGADARGCVTSTATDGSVCSNGNVCDGQEVCVGGACVRANATVCTLPGAIVFTLGPPTTGTLSYAGGSGALVGTNVETDAVTGVGTPSNAGVTGTCIGCRLNFQTGGLTGTTVDEWTFGPGGIVRVTGAVDFDGDNVIGPGDIASTLLIDGTFRGPAMLKRTGPISYQLTADLMDEKRAPLRNFYGMPTPTFSGRIQLTIFTAAQPPAAFTAAAVQDGYLSNAVPGCENTMPALPGTACDLDANLCTADHCDGLGTCLAGGLTTCADDGSLCNGPETCNPQTGTCQSGPPTPATTPCEADNNFCTIDQCDGSGNCATASNVVCSDDSNLCNGPETCNPLTGTCQSGPPPAATTPCDNDNNLCTVDQCDGNGTCAIASTVVCSDDSNLCNGPETCNPLTGTCQSGPPAAATTSCETDNNLCTVDQCNGSGACATASTVVCSDDGNLCNGSEACNPLTGTCQSGPLAPPATPCEADGNLCTVDVCNGAGACVLDANAPPGSSCDDGIFCNGLDTCDSSGQCNLHSGDPCPGTQCNTCQEATRSCFDPADTPCDPGIGLLTGACDGSGTCVEVNYLRDYAILRWPVAGPPDVTTFLRGHVQVGGHVCTDYITLRKLGVIDGDAVVPRPAPIQGMRFGFDSLVTGGIFTGGATILGSSRVTSGRGIDTTGTAIELQRCLTAIGQAEARWTSLNALPVTTGMALGLVRVPARSTQSMNVGPGVVVIETADFSVRPYGILKLVGTPSTQLVVVRVKGTRGLRLAGRSSITLEGLTPEQVVFMVTHRSFLGPFSTLNGTLFANDRIFVAGHGTVNGQIVGPKRINLNPYTVVNSHPFAGW
ncbi:hypothetical protein L6Q96_02690 [Candidatus Binatia bacterium]|nr:hypothetical protein [Candidatus Binatia bacterium]